MIIPDFADAIFILLLLKVIELSLLANKHPPEMPGAVELVMIEFLREKTICSSSM